tara:strand:+ start:687 stop:842 length:156 start_codon:yes stop_codon:yes gene_type:complete
MKELIVSILNSNLITERKGGLVVECVCLESVCKGNRIESLNSFSSATRILK